MIGKTFFGALAVAILVASASLTAVAQVGELRGHVWMQQADGQKVPLENAQIDVFRTDMTAKYNTKTNKKGEFVFAGLPFIGTYTVAASHPTAAPNFVPGVKAGREVACEITVTPGAGNTDEALAKYTAAVASYDEGLTADPEQPAILTNKAVALKGRGVERFNATVRSKTLDDAGKSAGLQQAKDDFKAAAEISGKAVTMIKALPVPTEAAEVQRYNGNKYAAMLTHAESMRLYVSKADGTQADAGLTAFKDYLALETDPAKKAKAQLDMAQMLLDAGAADKALTEFRAILTTTPDSPEANLGAGLAVYAIGDKAKFQEAANYLQRFVEVAPDSNPMKDDAKAILTELKNSENVTPEKT